MHHLLGALIVGGIAGGATSNRPRLRRTLRGLVKSGIVAKHKIQLVSTSMVEEAQKLVNEARTELDREETEPQS
jgi:hypothetical protein